MKNLFNVSDLGIGHIKLFQNMNERPTKGDLFVTKCRERGFVCYKMPTKGDLFVTKC